MIYQQSWNVYGINKIVFKVVKTTKNLLWQRMIWKIFGEYCFGTGIQKDIIVTFE